MENSKNQPSVTGRISFILFGSGIAWLALTTALTYLPRDNDFRSILTWLGLIIGFGFIFLGIPILLGSLITGIVSIIKDGTQKWGLITLGGHLILGVIIAGWLFR